MGGRRFLNTILWTNFRKSGGGLDRNSDIQLLGCSMALGLADVPGLRETILFNEAF